uniref:Uncharacterized protein n=1 Tax=Ciona intestinalis TaxID=7719 RepID=H2XUU6_CIOIN
SRKLLETRKLLFKTIILNLQAENARAQELVLMG